MIRELLSFGIFGLIRFYLAFGKARQISGEAPTAQNSDRAMLTPHFI